MNTLFYGVFEKILNVLHILVIVGLVLFWLNAVSNGTNILPLTLSVLGLFIAYILSMGVILTFISIDNALQRIEQQLEKK